MTSSTTALWICSGPMALPLSPIAMSLPELATMIRALMRLEMVVMVWRVLRVVEPVAPLVPDFLTGGMGGLMGTAMP